MCGRLKGKIGSQIGLELLLSLIEGDLPLLILELPPLLGQLLLAFQAEFIHQPGLSLLPWASSR